MTKYNMGHPPSSHELRCKVMLSESSSINLSADGIIGLSPLVLGLIVSDGSPVPMLKVIYHLSSNIKY